MIFNRKFWSVSTISAVILSVLIPTSSQAVAAPSVTIGALTGSTVSGGIVTGDAAAGLPVTLAGFSGASNVVATLSVPDNGGSLTVDNAAAGSSIALQTGYTAWTNVQTISIRGTVSDVTTLLASKVSWNAPMNSTPAQLSVNVTEFPTGSVYNPANGHFYKVVTGSSAISYQDADTAATATTFKGLTGYLATITSRSEQDFLAAINPTDAWIGASDAASEGTWKWVTGPEAGTTFWNGTYAGSPATGAFSYWSNGEPNNAGFGENFATFGKSGNTAGRWNDLDRYSNIAKSYIVEFGGAGMGTFTGLTATGTSNLQASNPLTLGTTTSGVFSPGYVRYAASTAVPFAVDVARYTYASSTNYSAVISIPDNTGTITISPTTGLTLSSGYSSFVGQKTIGFSGAKATVLAALKSRLVWNAPSSYVNLTPTVTLGEIDTDYYLNPSNGHYYKIVDPGGSPDWTASKSAAEALTYKGMTGYLATITTQEEQDFTKNNLPSNNMWLGATDDETYVNVRAQVTRSNQEGHWHWVTGPEAGTEFWSGNYNGSAVNGMFAGWRSGEPNNSSYSCPWYGCGSQQAYSGENYMLTNVSGYLGQWNDVSDNSESSNSYLVEFGGMPNEVSTAKSTVQTFTNGTTPDAPTTVTAAVKTRTLTSSGVATVSWNAPASDGNRVITKYVVTASPSGATCQATSTAPSTPATSCDVTGLSSFTNYTFTVKSTNSVGDSSASSGSNALDVTTAATNPGAPTSVTATAKTRTLGTDGVATVSWTAPSSNGNRTIIGYTVTSTPDGLTCSTSSTSPSTPATSCDISGLSALTSYTFKVKADNGSYQSAASSASSSLDVTSIATAPSVPTNVLAVVKTRSLTNNGVASLAWSAPSSNGNRTIIGYTVTASPGGKTCSTSSTAPSTPTVNCEVTGLNAFTDYTFSVTANNGTYVSSSSDASSSINLTTVASTPGAPTGVSATVATTTLTNTGEANVSWTAPTDKGNRSEITGYTVTSTPGGFTCSTSSTRPAEAGTTCTVTGLEAFTNYTFTVKADNGSHVGGSSSASEAVVVTTPATKPAAPTGVAATQTTRTLGTTAVATVNWNQPSDTGLRTIIKYVVTASPGGQTCTTTSTRPTPAATTCDISGLSAWTNYTFAVVASNDTFDSDASTPSSAIDLTTLPATPNAPRSVTASTKTRTLGNDGVATVSWTAPTANGYRTITKYTVTANPGLQTCQTTSVSPATPELTCDVAGLSAFTSYTFTVVANNGFYDSAASSASVAIGLTTAATNPDAPTGVTATASIRTMAKAGVASVSWTPPAFNGNRTLVKYIVTSTPGGKTCTTTSVAPETPATTCDISGLASFTDYTFAVKTENSSAWQSVVSTASAPMEVTTLPVAPSAPTDVTSSIKTLSVTNTGKATVSWTGPTFNGYRPITGYTVTSSPDGLSCSTIAPVTTCDVSGLRGFTAYTFTVTATNGYVVSDSSDASSSLNITNPPATPVAPSGVVAAAGTRTLTHNGVATVSWSAPADNGYRTIIGYTVTASPGGATCTSDSVDGIVAAETTCDVTGLDAFTDYTFTVTSGNGYFQSVASNASSAIDVTTLATAPDAVTDVTATLAHGTTTNTGSVTVAWTAPANTGNRAITVYTVTSTPGSKTCTTTGATSCVVKGLSAGVDYTFSVVAENGSFASAAADSATPIDVSMAPTAPTAPTGIQASVNADNQVTVVWQAPSDLGSSALRGYTVTASPGGETCIANNGPTCTFSDLMPGVEYTFSVTASNADAISTDSASSVTVDPGTPTEAPKATSITQVSVNNSNVVTVNWSAPTSAGSSSLTGYTVIATPGGATCVTTGALTCDFTSLTAGTNYTFSVVASNQNGDSAASSPSAYAVDPGVATSTPTTPTGIQAGVSGSGVVTVSWSAATAGSTPVDSYTVTANPGGATCIVASPATSCSDWMVDLSYALHEFSVVANSFTGSSAASEASVAVDANILTSNPSAPIGLQVAVGGDSAVTVSWDASSDAGSSDITGYVVVANPGGATCATKDSTICRFADLAPGTAYTFSVTVNNGNGGTTITSAAPVDPALRSSAPGTPSDVQSSVDNNGAVTVTWAAPTDLGTPVASYYIVTANPGGATCIVATPATSCDSWTPALNPGTEYTFSVAASSGNLTGLSTPDSVAVDPGVASVAPSEPLNTEVYVTANQSVIVLWDAPADEGNSALRGYRVTANPGGATCTTTGATTCIFPSLSRGTLYKFSVTAANGSLYSPAGNETTQVDPAVRTVLPTAPRILKAKFADSSAILTLRAPLSTGGVPLSRYEYRVNDGDWAKLRPGQIADTWKIANLVNGTRYSVQVRAVNPVGPSKLSNRRGVVPHIRPDAPTLISLTSWGTVANTVFAAPASNGGARVDYYAFSTDGGTTWTSWGRFANTPQLVRSLVVGTSYTVILRAHNSAGWSVASNALSLTAKR